MPRTNRKVDVVVEYIPDVSGLKKAMSTIQEIKIDIGGDALRKDFSSIQQSIRDINKPFLITRTVHPWLKCLRI